MKKLLVVTMLLMSCVVGGRRVRPDGQPAPLPEEMPLVREACTKMCKEAGRELLYADYDGNCVCSPAPVQNQPVPTRPAPKADAHVNETLWTW